MTIKVFAINLFIAITAIIAFYWDPVISIVLIFTSVFLSLYTIVWGRGEKHWSKNKTAVRVGLIGTYVYLTLIILLVIAVFLLLFLFDTGGTS